MKRTFTFYVTIFLTRILIFFMKLIGKKSTYFPGVFALKLCPDFLSMLEKPETIICVTGTNGKTTTTNMIADCLMEMGYDIAYNKLGSNMAEGVIATLLQYGTTFWGSSNKDIGVLEIDERMSGHIYKHMTPDYLVVINLYRDTIRREGNVEFVFDIIDKSIPKETVLVLNGDDIISTKLAPNNKRIYYSVAPLEGEEEFRDSLINDAAYDVDTGEKYEYSFLRYHHMGRIKGHSPAPDYELVKYNKETRDIEILNRGSSEEYRLISKNDTDLYNQLAAISLLREMGYEKDKIRDAFNRVKVIGSRYEETEVCGKKVILFLSKGSSPVAASRIVKHISDTPGRVAVILINEEAYDISFFNSWFYEIDYKQFTSDHIKQIVTGGYYCKDMHICLLLQGVEENKVSSEFNHVKTAELIDLDAADTIYLTYGLDTIIYKDDIRDRLIERIKEAAEKKAEEK